jgi:hypothetical protein
MWIQLLTGTAPTDGLTITGGSSGATCDVNVTVTTRTISKPFCGASTGSAIRGAYGLGIEATDLTSADQLTDLTGTPVTPPNNVPFTIAGLVSGEDRVLVTNDDGGDIDFAQLTLNTTLSGGSETAVVCTSAIPTDTPATGTIRIQLDSGLYRRVAYTSYTSATFTIGSTDFSGDNATSGNNVFVSYLDETASGATASFTGVFGSGRTLFVRVRDGGVTPIKPFETTASWGASAVTVTAIRTSDA